MSVSARDLSEVRKSTVGSEALVKHISGYIEKLDFIENRLIQLPQDFSIIQKSIESNKDLLSKESMKIYNSSMSNLKKVTDQLGDKIESVMEVVSGRDKDFNNMENKMTFLVTALNEYKLEMSANQERIAKFVSELIKNKNTIEETNLKIKSEEIKSGVEKHKNKTMLWVKIRGLLGASSGIAYLIVSSIIKALSQ